MATELNDFTLVGAGSLGAVLGRSLVKLGMRLDQVVVRNRSSGQRLVDEIGYGEVVEIQNWKGTDSNLVILCKTCKTLFANNAKTRKTLFTKQYKNCKKQ